MPANSQNAHWTVLEKISFRFFFTYVLLFIISVSFQHEFIPDTGKFTAPFFETMVKWCAENVLNIQSPYTYQLISDSTGLYIHSGILAFLSALICTAWTLLGKKKKNHTVLFCLFLLAARYYLAMQLFVYGFNKVFKWQFYLPEPNTLFTPLGYTYPDLLYWSAMGSSRPYTMFLGIAEVLAGCLLLFRRTKLFGAVFSAAIIINVLAINFSFNISVKLYSLFLFMLCCIVIAPDAKKMFGFFFGKTEIVFVRNTGISPFRNKWMYAAIKSFVTGFILFDALFMYIKANNFNDDHAPRPFLHGAYDIKLFVKNTDTIAALLTDTTRWKRIFIHRMNYLITQSMNDAMEDYTLEYDTLNHFLMIENHDDTAKTKLHYFRADDSTLFLNGKMYSDSLKIILRKINLNKLPLLQREFHWTMD